MKKWLSILAIFVCLPALAQNKTPLISPHWTFFDSAGAACAGCSLYTYVAGTTTPLATYTDASGASQNTNPIILDTSGSAQVWVGTTSLKLILKDASGTTIWSADNIVPGGGSGSPCGPASTIQIANSSVTGFSCDSLITINTTLHTINVGGALPSTHFSLTNLGTISSSWTFDVTSPATALASLSPIPLSDLATQGADTLLMNNTGATAVPAAVGLPAACSTADLYDRSTHTWLCASVATTPLALSNLATQAADTAVMNATASTAAPTAVAMPTGCLYGVNYSTSSHTYSCVLGGTTCVAGQCWRQNADASFDEWGTTPNFGGANGGSFSMTYPHAFTTLASITTIFSPSGCDGGSASYCATNPGGSPNNIYACMVISQSTTTPSVAYSSGNTVTAGSTCYFHAWGY